MQGTCEHGEVIGYHCEECSKRFISEIKKVRPIGKRIPVTNSTSATDTNVGGKDVTNSTQEPERIICACVRSADGENFYGKRHSDCLWLMRQFGVDYRDSIQGFYTTDHEFVSRRQATDIAIAAKQITKDHAGTDLYSEDLW